MRPLYRELYSAYYFRQYQQNFRQVLDDLISCEVDQEILISAVRAGFKINEIPVPVRYFPEASSINFMRSIRYGLMTLLTLLKYILFSLGIKSKIFSKKRNEKDLF